MTHRDWTEIGVWAGVTAVVATATFGARIVMSAGNAPTLQAPSAIVGSCRITAVGQPVQVKGGMTAKLNVVNTATAATNYSFQLAVVKREFTGNPASRVMSANDYKLTTLDTESVTGLVDGAATKEVSVFLKADEAAPANAEQKQQTFTGRASYLIMVNDGPKSTTISYVAPASAPNVVVTATSPQRAS